ncbi:MAG TPA: topoisomerase C-terminal repeat-containing protein, partial [Caldimonas sp.]
AQEPLGKCPKTNGSVFEFGANYVCEHSVGPAPTCDFKSGKVILQQPVAREQMTKLLATGATDLLEGFVSNKTRRKFKARLQWDAKEGKVAFAFEPRPERRSAAKKAVATALPVTAVAASGSAELAKKTPAKKTPAKKATAERVVAKKAVVSKKAVKRAAAKTG